MRRKIIQEFVNSFCQRVIDLPDGYDLATFAYYGSGSYMANILTGESSHNGNPIERLRLCDVYQQWMHKQLDKYGIELNGIKKAILQVNVEVKDVNLRSSFGHRYASAHFFFVCQSEIGTDEKLYMGTMNGDKQWGFDWYYERLYGNLPETWPSQ
jgi:hypothetical protein